jgi:hypothetical protein
MCGRLVAICLGVAALAAGCGGMETGTVGRPNIVFLQKGPAPKDGLLVERGGNTLLVTLDGKPYARVVGLRPWWAGGDTTKDFAFRQLAEVASGRTLLVGAENSWYELDAAAGQLRRLTSPRLRLSDEVEVVARAHELPEETGSVVVHVSVERKGHPLLARSNDVQLVSGSLVATETAALDVSTGRRWKLPRGCVPAGARADELFTLCGPPYASEPPRLVALSGTGRRRILASLPKSLYVDQASLSPDGAYLLASLAPGCGSPYGFVLPLASGAVRPVTGERSWSWKSPSSTSLGWTADGRIVASIHPLSDCSSEPHAGVYLIDPRTLARTYVYPSSAWAMWHSRS